MSTLHFSKEIPPDHMYKEIQSLNRFSVEQFEELSTLAIQLCLDPAKGGKALEELEEFSSRHGASHNTVSALFKSLLTVTNGALRNCLSGEQLASDLQALGLTEDNAAIINKQWSVNQSSLSRSALSQTLMVNQLVDMEWKFGVTAASSDLNKVGNTFLQLKLLINKGNKMETVYMELSLNQFYSFLHEMEKAKASLDYFS